MEKEFKRTFRAYHKYIAYRNKLLHELTMSEDDKERMLQLDRKFKKNIKKASNRVDKDDWE